MQEARELAIESCYEYEAHPLEVYNFLSFSPLLFTFVYIYTNVVISIQKLYQDNLFEWHFTVRGPGDTEFEEGRLVSKEEKKEIKIVNTKFKHIDIMVVYYFLLNTHLNHQSLSF